VKIPEVLQITTSKSLSPQVSLVTVTQRSTDERKTWGGGGNDYCSDLELNLKTFLPSLVLIRTSAHSVEQVMLDSKIPSALSINSISRKIVCEDMADTVLMPGCFEMLWVGNTCYRFLGYDFPVFKIHVIECV
jgi:hypothetical protein